MNALDHKTFDTVETETGEAGSFVALVSTYTPDRQRERVMPGAFSRSLAKWRESGKMIPVLADHDGQVGAVVGHVDPRLTHETKRGLEAAGSLDRSTKLGARVYELVKSGSLSWSIGYVVPDGGRRRAGKVIELTEIDLAEISAVATPANADARTLSIKSAAGAKSLGEMYAQFEKVTKGIDTRPAPQVVTFRSSDAMRCQARGCTVPVTPEMPRCWWHERKLREKRRARWERNRRKQMRRVGKETAVA